MYLYVHFTSLELLLDAKETSIKGNHFTNLNSCWLLGQFSFQKEKEAFHKLEKKKEKHTTHDIIEERDFYEKDQEGWSRIVSSIIHFSKNVSFFAFLTNLFTSQKINFEMLIEIVKYKLKIQHQQCLRGRGLVLKQQDQVFKLLQKLFIKGNHLKFKSGKLFF